MLYVRKDNNEHSQNFNASIFGVFFHIDLHFKKEVMRILNTT